MDTMYLYSFFYRFKVMQIFRFLILKIDSISSGYIFACKAMWDACPEMNSPVDA